MFADKTTDNQILEFADTFFSDFPDAVILTSPVLEPTDSEILYTNQKLLNLFGYSQEELLFANPDIFIGDKTNSIKVLEALEVLATDCSAVFSTVVYRKDGSFFHSEWKVTPIRGEAGDIMYFLSVIRDLSFIKRFVEKVKSQNDHFRWFLKEFVPQISVSDQRATTKQRIKEATFQDIQTSAFFCQDPRSDKPISVFEYEVLGASEQNLDILTVAKHKMNVSAEEYAKIKNDRDYADRLQHIIEDIQVNIELTLTGERSKQCVYYCKFKNSLKNFAEVVFFIDEFIEFSTAMSQLVDVLEQVACESLDEIHFQLLCGVAEDMYEWFNAVFIDRTAKDIHERDASILSSIKQVIKLF
ncbi:PAS domain-containing protein [Pseudoalteromonas pernae]|uniref:PAS domain-containing protein n=1 Tax=Pseudoalteromonas pernae TaxID=3118054 RepID=UPI003242517F